MSLNNNFNEGREDKISAEDRALIADFIARKGVKRYQPGSAASNEATRATNELVAQKRREFRANRRKAAVKAPEAN